MRPLPACAIALVKQFESCSLEPYLDGAGIPTQGWGHTANVFMSNPAWTQATADAVLASDLAVAQGLIEHYIDAELNDNQYGALVSLVFNEGTAPLDGHLGQYLNDEDYESASDEFDKWIYIHVDGKPVIEPGLVRRRAAEKALFLAPCPAPVSHVD